LQVSKELQLKLTHIANLRRAFMLLEWDTETYLPPSGVEYRSDQLSTLATIIHTMITDPKLQDAIQNEIPKLESASIEQRALSRLLKDMEIERQVPESLRAEIARYSAIARNMWLEARRLGDFGKFIPALEKNVQLLHELASTIGYEGHPYNALLKLSEPDFTVTELDNLFSQIQSTALSILEKVIEANSSVDDRFLYEHYPRDMQIRFGINSVAELGYDLSQGRVDISAHPFTQTVGPTDVRITTRVRENYFPECFFSLLHEAGHALYAQGIAKSLEYLLAHDSPSLGADESQSRFYENCVGRSKWYWKRKFDELKNTFRHHSLDNVTYEDFFRAINKITRSPIRVDADEFTYNLHIIIRYRIEKSLMSKEITVKDIPDAWRELSKQLIGSEIQDDNAGPLQDIHWTSCNGFGIFPSYTIGNLIAAQLYLHLEKIGIIHKESDLKVTLGSIKSWLRENFWKYGKTYSTKELIKLATGNELDISYWNDYIKAKASEIWQLPLS